MPDGAGGVLIGVVDPRPPNAGLLGVGVDERADPKRPPVAGRPEPNADGAGALAIVADVAAGASCLGAKPPKLKPPVLPPNGCGVVLAPPDVPNRPPPGVAADVLLAPPSPPCAPEPKPNPPADCPPPKRPPLVPLAPLVPNSDCPGAAELEAPEPWPRLKAMLARRKE